MKLAIIGTGSKARQYIDAWAPRLDVDIMALADPSAEALSAAAAISARYGMPDVALFTEWEQMLGDVSAHIDAVYICTPHAYHADQAIAALDAGCDVLLEKPMVMTPAEARRVVDAERSSGKTLVVAYQGGLSPLVQRLRADVRNHAFGTLTNINAAIWENWSTHYSGHWKQQPAISGGGFLFDTGAHLLNTVSLICNADVDRLAAFVDNRGYPVDSVAAIAGRLTDGTLFTINGAGDTIPTCASRIELFFSEAIVRVCAWGRWIEIERPDKAIERREQESANNLMDVFQQVLGGTLENPSTAEQGLRLATLWQTIQSAATSGQIVIAPLRAAS